MEQSGILKRLLDAGQNGAQAHCYLFCGSDGDALLAAAKKFASTSLSVDLAHLDIHPDFFVLDRGGKEDVAEKEISIGEVRELKSRLSLTALTGKKIAIIERAELLSQDAASALLKILEEPAAGTVLILTAERFRGVLPTIRSRAVRVNFPPAKKGVSKAFSLKTQKDLEKIFSEISTLPYALRFKISERYAKNPEDYRNLLGYAETKLRGELAACLEQSKSPVRVMRSIRSLIRTDALFTHTNTNARMLMDAFLMQM